MFAQNALIAETANLKKFALRLTGNKADADDLVQSTFLRALEKADYFEDGTSLRKWASKIMFNLFVTEYRRKTKFETQYDPEPYIHSQSVEPAQEHKAELHTVGDAINKLSPDHREVLMMVCIKDMPYQEVSEALDIPVGTVRSRLSRARESLHMVMSPPARRTPANISAIPAHIAARAMQHHNSRAA